MMKPRRWQDELKELAVEHRRVMKDLLLEIFPPNFIKNHTSYRSLPDLCSDLPEPINNVEDIRNIPPNVLNLAIEEQSGFDCWDNLWNCAVDRWKKSRDDVDETANMNEEIT